MIKNVQRGLLDSIPQNLLYEEVLAKPHVFEFSQFPKSSHLSACARTAVQMKLFKALLEVRETLSIC